MPKGLHALRYSEKFPGSQRLFYLNHRQNTSSVMPTEIDKGEWRRRLHSHNFDEGILFQPNSIFWNGRVCQTSYISPAETYPIPKVFLPKQTRVHAPWVLAISFESLALIRRTDWGLMRHSLCEKTIQGWYMTICSVWTEKWKLVYELDHPSFVRKTHYSKEWWDNGSHAINIVSSKE